jgi:CheY-like chemotaxis protein
VADLATLDSTLSRLKDESSRLLLSLSQHAHGFEDAVLYQFPDSDLLLVARPRGDTAHEAFYDVFKNLSATLKAGLVDFINFGREMMAAQKLADRKFLSGKRMGAYAAMIDTHRVSSIPVRRQRREHAVIQVVEDDRFTASYTMGILNKTYEAVLSKSGEDAIHDYIEHAPDIVFLDIHLPGLNGIETLHALRQIDPEAYVVMLSVDTVKANIVAATNHGAAGFLKKPFSKDRLLTIVAKSPFIKGPKVIHIQG